ncbi:hypothetical protein B0H34DRAFT_719306 [Crassisporium funariophilum]|nr:hypothetical protein B0H34DRAFT_719306 [Crassisporium funariophilum]
MNSAQVEGRKAYSPRNPQESARRCGLNADEGFDEGFQPYDTGKRNRFERKDDEDVIFEI